MGGMVAQLVYQRHASLVSGLVLCSTAGYVGSPAQQLAAFALPARAAGLRWNPVLQLVSAEILRSALLGSIDDPATARWARAQLRRTTLVSALSAIQAVSQFSSDGGANFKDSRGRRPELADGQATTSSLRTRRCDR